MHEDICCIGEYKMPLIGEKFPEVEVKTTQGAIKLPEHFEGKWFVLFSHPADFTPVCTTEFVAFQNRYDQFKELNTELIGLSIDQVFSHLKWIEWIKDNLDVDIEFPVVADDRGQLAERLGMVSPYKGNNTVRAVFIVDDKGAIRAILYYPQEAGRNIDEIIRLVKALQTSDKGVALPANWPNNEIIGDKVIVPPASTVEEMKSRKEAAEKGEIECLDWWLCCKKLE
ncbi:alkyl hydroperoxide reductase/ Thiol specific antioxidant/ Mal allergen [Methanococcus aeolicus Nankai-3]|jgi:peroxiredoxin (alkyl hydroperoxide reductase subunit C)|uniref:Peroxiredoxin n=2 Tax=Methanococcus aeolicus TaxID=42879 RepID=A6UTU2_META3|nr:alkyl hydroperoxide reductase/ Thiol specific antioxidant/ Mal allergen [Methanococcus aeolicus Nankai-3]